MQIIQGIITGIVQGLSEFLPISSSAHIVFSNKLFNLMTHSVQTPISSQEEIFFDIMVHLASLFAVIIYFFGDLKKIFFDFVQSIKTKNYNNENTKLVLYVALATVITGIIGLIIKEKVENLIQNPSVICFLLLITGTILILSEKFYKGDKKLDLKKALVIAIAQGLAIFPGFSRSGFTISTALFLGMKRLDAARFSFLMSIPVILLASLIYPMLELDLTEFAQFNLKAIIFGTSASFVSGYFCIKYFMQLLEKLSLRIFGVYCFVVGLLVLGLLQVFRHQLF